MSETVSELVTANKVMEYDPNGNMMFKGIGTFETHVFVNMEYDSKTLDLSFIKSNSLTLLGK